MKLNPYSQLRQYLALPGYLSAWLRHQVYFGRYMLAGQTHPARIEVMKRIIRKELQCGDQTFNVLEVGSWAGQSALLWAQAIRESGREGYVWCVDPWRVKNNNAMKALDIMASAAQHDRIYPLFWRNVKAAKAEDVIIPIRTVSRNVLGRLQSCAFDLVYIDGSHCYKDVRLDLWCSGWLVRDGGVLCGDDLEVQLEDVDADYARLKSECDYVMDAASGMWYHPGVTLAVNEYLGHVACVAGFWAMRWIKGKWIGVELGEVVKHG
jgi:predicted O-methyltransferase YrrM